MATINDSCPSCGSSRVRWRKRRWYDGPLNFIETMMSGATVINANHDIGALDRAMMSPRTMERTDIQEGRKMMGRRTAELFWKCPDCEESGEDYKGEERLA